VNDYCGSTTRTKKICLVSSFLSACADFVFWKAGARVADSGTHSAGPQEPPAQTTFALLYSTAYGNTLHVFKVIQVGWGTEKDGWGCVFQSG